MKSEAKALEKLLTRALIDPGKAPQLIGEALEILHGLRDKQVKAEADDEARTSRNKPTSYQVRAHGDGEVLEEFRPGDPYPFRCPRSVYDALVEFLSGIKTGLHFKDLMAGVTKAMGSEPSDYLLRICVRLWLRADPPLLRKDRARYYLINPTQFRKQAARLWQELTKATVQP